DPHVVQVRLGQVQLQVEELQDRLGVDHEPGLLGGGDIVGGQDGGVDRAAPEGVEPLQGVGDGGELHPGRGGRVRVPVVVVTLVHRAGSRLVFHHFVHTGADRCPAEIVE